MLNNNAGDAETIQLDRIEFGQLAQPESATTITSITGPVVLHVGQSIEGPIARFKVGTNEGGKGVLAYFK
jgi:CRISPR/Cas system type I-B associated protein Csh2 (Cas7 group RAMP superfamily)